MLLTSSASITPKIGDDLRRLLEDTQLKIRWAYGLIAFGVNATEHGALAKLDLPSVMRAQFPPKPLPDGVVQQVKQEFRTWVVSNGLREVAEIFSNYLDRIFEISCNMICVTGAIHASDVPKAVKRFALKSVSDKLGLLDQELGIRTTVVTLFLTFSNVLNCLSRSRGVVGPRDVDHHGRLAIRWRGVDLIVVSPDGSETIVPPAQREPTGLDAGASFMTRAVDRERALGLGDVVNLEAYELDEICFSFHLAAKEIGDATAKYAQTLGLRIDTLPPVAGGADLSISTENPREAV
jgi:hypothetical protein